MHVPRQSVSLSRSWILGLILCGSLLSGCITNPGAGRRVEKSIWVSRYEYKTQADIDRIMRRCAAAGFESVMFQVRGNGTVLFASRAEIWSDQFGFRAPAFDPLSHAILSARRNGLKLHAWINVMPGWGGAQPPRSRQQLYHRRPEWFLKTNRGEFAKEGSYWFLNPCLPEVRNYLAGLCEEVASGYRVDGIHLDYIRFPHGPASERSPGDAQSRRLFARWLGREPAASDGAAFRAFKAESVTRLVSDIRNRLKRQPRRIQLTVAVNSNLDRIRKDVLQDWPRWARDRLVDAVFPMNYTERDALFESRSRACVAAAGSTPVIMGVGVYAHQRARQNSRTTVRQMNSAVRNGAAGVCLFSYGSAFEGEWGPAVAQWNRRQ